MNRFVQGFNVCPLAFESEGVAVASSRANFDERLLAKVDLAGYAIYIHLSWVAVELRHDATIYYIYS